MRRSHDGYISATGMFKATFPYAEALEEEMERKYIKSLETTSTDETAGNVWVPPQHALELAAEYQILPWIKALLDNTPIDVNPTKDASPKAIASPPQFLIPSDFLAAPEPTPTVRRSHRSVSPSKIASPKKPIASMRKPRTSKLPKAEKSDDAESSEVSTKTSSKNLQSALKEASTEEDTKLPEVKEEPVVRVNVDTDVEVKGDVEITHTHVEVEMPAGFAELPLPADTEAMISKAKEMVEAAVEASKESNAGGPSVVRKRKVEEVEEAEAGESAVVAAPAKKVKVESELKKERIKTRALIGLSATLAIGYVSLLNLSLATLLTVPSATIQYVFGAF